MSYGFLTADIVGDWTGGGSVTKHEKLALSQLAEQDGKILKSADRTQLKHDGPEPWKWDVAARELIPNDIEFCHIYSGTWPTTVKKLKAQGAKVSISVVAHDRKISMEEHNRVGLAFQFPHLTQEDIWQVYIEGYRQADLIFCPSSVPAEIVRNYGPEFKNKWIEVIPHGCELPKEVRPLPKRFVVGYMGCCGGPDKGLRYLLEAWHKLALRDSLLILAGKDSDSPWVTSLINRFGTGTIYQAGWQNNVSDFYNSISVLAVASPTEGFNLEVLEALAHNRIVLCSEGAGAVDLISSNNRIPVRDVNRLMERIKNYYDNYELIRSSNQVPHDVSSYTWDKIRQRYIEVWRKLLCK